MPIAIGRGKFKFLLSRTAVLISITLLMALLAPASPMIGPGAADELGQADFRFETPLRRS